MNFSGFYIFYWGLYFLLGFIFFIGFYIFYWVLVEHALENSPRNLILRRVNLCVREVHIGCDFDKVVRVNFVLIGERKSAKPMLNKRGEPLRFLKVLQGGVLPVKKADDGGLNVLRHRNQGVNPSVHQTVKLLNKRLGLFGKRLEDSLRNLGVALQLGVADKLLIVGVLVHFE